MTTQKGRENLQGWLSVLPVLVLELLVCAYPIATAIMKSFTNWDGLFQSDLVWFRNYTRLITDSDFWLLFKNTAILLVSIPIQAFIGVGVAVALYEKIKGWKFFRLVYYLPSIISMVTVGYLFRIMFGFTGPLNSILRIIGLDALAIEWLGSSGTALSVVLLCLVWSNIGWQVLVVFGGLSSISPSVFEAAMIDGAGYWQRFFKITIPLLLRTLEYSFIMGMLWIFSGIFPLIYSITKGGPGYGTTTIDYMIYVKGFIGSKLGQACALAVILLFIILLITKLQMSIANKMDDWGD